jgi:hypothetical protein
MLLGRPNKRRLCCRGESQESKQENRAAFTLNHSLAQRIERAATPKISTTAA